MPRSLTPSPTRNNRRLPARLPSVANHIPDICSVPPSGLSSPTKQRTHTAAMAEGASLVAWLGFPARALPLGKPTTETRLTGPSPTVDYASVASKCDSARGINTVVPVHLVNADLPNRAVRRLLLQHVRRGSEWPQGALRKWELASRHQRRQRRKANVLGQRPNSMLTFESSAVLGQDAITEKLVVRAVSGLTVTTGQRLTIFPDTPVSEGQARCQHT